MEGDGVFVLRSPICSRSFRPSLFLSLLVVALSLFLPCLSFDGSRPNQSLIHSLTSYARHGHGLRVGPWFKRAARPRRYGE